MSEPKFDTARAAAFEQYVNGILNGGMLALMTSIGHRTGLFDAMAGRGPSTSREIADAAGLNERYVREWLAAMVTGNVVEYHPGDRTYVLPAEHAACLTRAAGPKNRALFMQYVPLLGNVETELAECFRKGGGVPYARFPHFQKLLMEESAAVFDGTLMGTLDSVPGLTAKLDAGIDAADVGCGGGHVVNLMAKAFPRSRFTGYDISEEGIELGRREARELGLTNARFEVRDAGKPGVGEIFDLITAFDAIHDQVRPADVLREIYRALRPGGMFLMQEMAASSRLEDNLELEYAPYMYAVSTMHCMTVSLADGGAGLGTGWGEQLAREMLLDAGFTRVDVVRAPGDPRHNNFVARKE